MPRSVQLAEWATDHDSSAASAMAVSDLSRKSGDIIAEALRHPVTLTQRNKPRLVIMNVEDYEKTRKQADPRRALTIDQLSEVVSVEEMQAAIDGYEKGSDTE